MRESARDGLRLALAGAGVVAITYQFADRDGDPGFSATNFFSFFTIQSNLVGIVVLGATAIVARESRTPLFEAIRGAATLYMAITGAVFALFLSGLQESLQTAIPWVDFIVHRLLPLVLVLDWLADPPRHRIPLRVAAAWLLYPAAYFVYTLIRGASVDWYPYPFVDVSELGYSGVLLRSAFLLVGMAVAAAAVAAVGNRLRRPSTLTGTVWYRERLALPPATEVIVELLDVSRADAPAVTVAEQRQTFGGRQVPIPFELLYGVTDIDKRHTYAVRAEIRVDGSVRFRSTEARHVLTRGHPKEGVELMLVAAP